MPVLTYGEYGPGSINTFPTTRIPFTFSYSQRRRRFLSSQILIKSCRLSNEPATSRAVVVIAVTWPAKVTRAAISLELNGAAINLGKIHAPTLKVEKRGGTNGKQRKKSHRLHSNLGQFSRTVHAVMGIVRTLKGIPSTTICIRRYFTESARDRERESERGWRWRKRQASAM